jgi:hypothetical protein
VGYYADGPVRYRLAALLAPDDRKADEVWTKLRSRPGAVPVAGLGTEGLAVSVAAPGSDARHEYVFGRKGRLVAAVGDEELSPAPHLSKDAKSARLKAWLAGRDEAKPGPSSKK